jgi:hypothetical protein
MKKIMKYFLVALITLVLAKEDLLSLMTFAKEEVYEVSMKENKSKILSDANIKYIGEGNIDWIIYYPGHGCTDCRPTVIIDTTRCSALYCKSICTQKNKF